MIRTALVATVFLATSLRYKNRFALRTDFAILQFSISGFVEIALMAFVAAIFPSLRIFRKNFVAIQAYSYYFHKSISF